MKERNFRELLEQQWSRGNFVCVGLDTEYKKLPTIFHGIVGFGTKAKIKTAIISFNCAIVDATKDLVCAYKPNAAFYEAYGALGWEALRDTIVHIQNVAPTVPVILDAKRADIGSTNAGYVRAAFDYLRADAITVHPYLGAETLQPFLDRADKGIIVLCRTSNPGAGEFQDVEVTASVEDEKRWGIGIGDNLYPASLKFYEYVALRVANDWNKNENCALVVGAPYPDELREVRGFVGDMPILIPSVGFQQKDVSLETQVKQVVSAGKDSRGRGMIINSSRGIIYASNGADFAEAARAKTIELRDFVNQFR